MAAGPGAAGYPSHLTQGLQEGQITPSHGGTVTAGQEFDLPITQQQQPIPRLSSSANTTTKQRPLSMPPQMAAVAPPPPSAYGAPTTSQATSAGTSSERSSGPTRGERDRDRDRERSSSRRHRESGRDSGRESGREGREGGGASRSRTNRILGDYTLSKTLGAGSMGKVKLATHNVTGEKVCLFTFHFNHTLTILSFRSLSSTCYALW
jgi:serine/threonine protein kinase KIN1/2